MNNFSLSGRKVTCQIDGFGGILICCHNKFYDTLLSFFYQA
jgi:hypothetical protein